MLLLPSTATALARETINLMIQTIDKGPTGALGGQTFLLLELFTPENI